jgi:bisphosphoglycerate-dependent phosphoglycerate mutase
MSARITTAHGVSNERHYGALQGLTNADTAEEVGEALVKI